MGLLKKLESGEIQNWLANAHVSGVFTPSGFDREVSKKAQDFLYPESIQEIEGCVLALVRLKSGSALAVFGSNKAGFSGRAAEVDETAENCEQALFCICSHNNAEILRKELPFTAPSPLAGQDVTFGTGDRLGVASAGHIRLFKNYKAAPVLAQQSVRELDLTGRSYEEVLDAATWAVFQEGFNRVWGADGDHLKTEDWVKKALKIGFTMITADVSDYIRGEFQDRSESELSSAYSELDETYRARIEKEYPDKEVKLDTGDVVKFEMKGLALTTLIYREAIEHAEALYRAGVQAKGEGSFDFELSIDETHTPTTPVAHLFIAMEVEKAGIKVSSMAPRFVGEFQKGIDYIGDTKAFARSFKIHAAIARKHGYRISVHSGSDKFAVYPIIGELTEGRFHIKTAGTNWLEAVKVIAQKNPALYRTLHEYALKVFEKARSYYHVNPNPDNLPDISKLKDSQLPDIFSNPDARQVIHITYGEILKNTDLNKNFFCALNEHIEDYWIALEKHIGRHLKLLGL